MILNQVRSIMFGHKNANEIYRGRQLIWRKNKNLFHPKSKTSPFWDMNASMNSTGGGYPFTSGPTRKTYFFLCQPNTTYQWTSQQKCDRFVVCTIKKLFDPVLEKMPTAYKTLTMNTNYSQNYTFTTGAEDVMIGIYYSLNTMPDLNKIIIEKIQ